MYIVRKKDNYCEVTGYLFIYLFITLQIRSVVFLKEFSFCSTYNRLKLTMFHICSLFLWKSILLHICKIYFLYFTYMYLDFSSNACSDMDA